MAWMLSPVGIGVIVVFIVLIASLIYWKRKPLKKWFASRKVGVTLKAGPVEVSLDEKDKPKATGRARAGVSFGTGNDFTGARITGVAGRDIRRGSAAAGSPGGQTPGVDFGEKNKFPGVQIEDITGCDLAED